MVSARGAEPMTTGVFYRFKHKTTSDNFSLIAVVFVIFIKLWSLK